MSNEFKRMQKLAGIIIESKKSLNKDELHVITDEENNLLFDYFKNEQDEEIENVSGETAAEAAKIIGPEGYEDETLQHILTVLFPDKYEAYY